MNDPIIDSEKHEPASVRLLMKDRVLMFLNEYYFPKSKALTLIRIVTGPLMIYIGLKFLADYQDRVFAYFSIFYGIYLIVRPAVWILFRIKSYRTVDVVIDVQEDYIFIKDQFSESKILFEGFELIMKKRWYYVLQADQTTKLYLPFYLFTDLQREVLERNLD